MTTKPVSYLQTDSRWSGNDYSAAGESTTIGKAGCGPTSMAMVIATWEDSTVTPAVTAAWSLEHGYKAKGQGTYYSYFKPQGAAYGLTVTQLNGSNLRNLSAATAALYHAKALAAIQAGNYVICCMGAGNWTSSGHFVLWWGLDGDEVLINDPASTKAARTRAALSLLQDEVKYYFVCQTPEVKKEETTVEKSTPSSWAEEAAEWAQEEGLIKGDENGDCKWQDSLTREQFAVILKRYHEKFNES